MGNHRFRLSDMMPNSWFYKLKDMSRASRNKTIQNSVHKGTTTNAATMAPNSSKIQHDYTPNRPSYYLPSRQRLERAPHSPVNTKASDTHFPVGSPVKQRPNTRKNAANSDAKLGPTAQSSSCSSPADSYKVTTSDTDIVLSVCGERSSGALRGVQDMEEIPELRLPPILTKPVRTQGAGASFRNMKGGTEGPTVENKRSSLSGIRRRIVSQKVEAYRNLKGARRERTGQFFDSFVVVKSSVDPQRDFRDSMIEMIVENDIRALCDLEELLACYLSLNCKEYHEFIVKAFEQIWFELNYIRC